MVNKQLTGSDKKSNATKKGSFGTPQSPKCIADVTDSVLNPKIIRNNAGYPVISVKEFMRMNQVPSDSNTVITFDFQGFVESEENPNLRYIDVLATNCLRDGIRLTVVGTGAESWERVLRDPSEVRMYEFGIDLPPEVQENENIEDTYIIIRVRLRPEIGREGIKCIYRTLVAYIEAGHPLARVEEFVREWERYILQNPERGNSKMLAD